MDDKMDKIAKNIEERISNGESAEEVIAQNPDAEVFIIAGNEKFTNLTYIKGVHFDEDKAREAMSRIPRGGGVGCYEHPPYIIKGTVEELMQGKIIDPKSNRIFKFDSVCDRARVRIEYRLFHDFSW